MTHHQPDLARRRSRRTGRRTMVAAAAIVIAVAACGGGDADDGSGLSGGDAEASAPSEGVRTVEVAMADNEFAPARVEVAPGETVRFVFTNEGEVTHDAVVGDEAAQAEHEDEMRAAEDDAMGGMDHGADAENDEGAITVDPGETGELTHTFAAGDGLLIGCHEPGHYDAGMRIDVAVTDA